MTYAIQCRDCETLYGPAGKWREVATGFATREEAQKWLDSHAFVGGYYMDFSICVESR